MSRIEPSSAGCEYYNYFCAVCDEKFKFKHQLTLHAFVHEIKKFECPECHELYISDRELEKHRRKLHEYGCHKLKCDLCSKQFSTHDRFVVHCATHFNPDHQALEKRDFNCSLCDKSFSSQILLDIHFRVHSGEKPYVCDVCGEDFVCAAKFRMHRKIHKPKITPKPKLYHCTRCPKVFNLKIDLQDHDNFHLNFYPYKCSRCDAKFPEFKMLKKHRRVHDKPTYTCHLCPKKYRNENNLQNHVAAHLEDKLHECKICHQTFNRSDHVKKHMLSHTGEKPFGCNMCHKTFSCKYNLKMHYRIHTGEKPFSCEICNKSFRQKNILAEHYNSHKNKNKIINS